MFVMDMMCSYCKHRDGGGCRAFPAGLPAAIVHGDYDHRRPHPGDGGIRFEAKDEAEWQGCLLRQMMDGELDGFERFPELYALRAAEAQETAVTQDK